MLSGGDQRPDADRMVRGDRAAVGQEFAGVVEEDDAVAEQAPPLLGVEGDSASRIAVRTVSWGARRLMWTHGTPLVWGCGRD
jgi:hypothetical protein